MHILTSRAMPMCTWWEESHFLMKSKARYGRSSTVRYSGTSTYATSIYTVPVPKFRYRTALLKNRVESRLCFQFFKKCFPRTFNRTFTQAIGPSILKLDLRSTVDLIVCLAVWQIYRYVPEVPS
eukprot:SAG11_NODE_756_length_7324_cov_13.486505_7_plen_124_part_00